MLLVLPVPFRSINGRLMVEAQAANGLDRWADSFDEVVVAAPLIPEEQAERLPGFVWRDVEELEHRARIVCKTLPWAYKPAAFVAAMGDTRRRLGKWISEATHLQFAIGGLLGDWAAVAALEATKQGRRFAIHTDRVEHEVILKTAGELSAARRLRVRAEAPLMMRYHRHLIRHCSLGLWHGADCFRAYAPWCRESHLVHDVHTHAADLVSAAELAEKLERVRTGDVLRVCYAGRLDPMKAPLEWLKAIAEACRSGARLEATWYGEGPLLEAAQTEAARLGLSHVVRFAGFVAGRAELLRAVQQADAFVFTHVTPESPRNLLEALVSGTAIVGYGNAYAVNLLEGRGGGELVQVHGWASLGQALAALAKDRARLAQLTAEAAANGRRFTDAAVFAERSELIKRYA